MSAEVALALFVGSAATAEDLYRRRISDWISISATVGGLAVQIAGHGWRGGVDALLGAICGFCVFLIFALMGGMGGGDIKLMAGFGAILGWKRLLVAALLTAAIGGIQAMFCIAGNALANAVRRARSGEGAIKKIEYIPYAPAITLGAWLALVPVG